MGRSAYLGQYSPTRITGWSWVMAAPFRWDAHAPVWNKSHLPVLGLHHHLYYQLLLQSTGCRRASSLLSSSAIHWLEIWLLPQFCHVAFWSFSSDGPWSCFRTVSWVTPLHSSYVGDIYMLSPGWPSTTGLSTICLRCWLSAPLLTYFLLCGQPWLHFEASSDPENVDKAQNQASSLFVRVSPYYHGLCQQTLNSLGNTAPSPGTYWAYLTAEEHPLLRPSPLYNEIIPGNNHIILSNNYGLDLFFSFK